MTSPKASVVIPCYNHGCYLAETIDSVRQQSLCSLEIIIVNDGSTDPKTLELLEKYSSDDISVLHTANRGVVAARNLGISRATGEYILALDADDRIAPQYLALATDELERDLRVGIVYGLVEFFGDRSGVWQQPEFSTSRLLYENMIVASAVYRRADWECVGGYSETMCDGWEDWDFWLSIVERDRKVVKIPEVVFHYRILENSRDRSLPYSTKMKLLLRLMRNHPRLYFCNMGPFLSGLISYLAGNKR